MALMDTGTHAYPCMHDDLSSHEWYGQSHLHACIVNPVPTLRAAILESSSDLAPVQTILPLAKISAVVLGSRIRMMTAAKRCVCVCACVCKREAVVCV